MSDEELKHYFLSHRQDKAALEAYLLRRRQRSLPIITRVDDNDFEAKIKASILEQMSQ
ncbi:hypothetical protein NG798_17020 [Ancylothrix sp. C2]|nr:hypothetical protein [Ancylothrix sp. D3o]